METYLSFENDYLPQPSQYVFALMGSKSGIK